MKIQKSRPPISRASLLAAAALLSVAPPAARAANFFWDANGTTSGVGGSGVWDNVSPVWSSGLAGTDAVAVSAFTSGDVAYFAGSGSYVVTAGGPFTVGGLNFSAPEVLIDSVGGSITLASPAGSPVQPSVHVGFGSRATLDLQISGTSGFSKTGNGTLVLASADNDFTGPLFIRSGAVVVTDAAQLGAGTDPVRVIGWASTGSPGFSGGALVVKAPDAVTDLIFSRSVSVGGRGPGSFSGTGGLVSIGNVTYTGTVALGVATSESRITSTAGNVTLAGDVHLGAGNATLFYGNGNFIVSGQVNNHDYSQDRIIKAGHIYGTTLWLQNEQNSFTSGVRIDSGTVRVSSAGALGFNTGRLSVDLNNGRLEVRSDQPAGFADKNVFVRDNTNSSILVDHALGSAAVGGTFQFGDLNAARNNTWFYLNSRNGFGASFTGLNGLIGGGGGNNAGINNDGNGLLTLDANLWNQGDPTARRFYIRGNGDTLVTGSLLQSHASAAHAFSKEGQGYLTMLGTAGTTRGSVDIVGGTLEIRGVGAFANASTINLGGGSTTGDQPGTLVYAGPGETLAKPILLAGKFANSIPMLMASGTGALVLTGNITAADTVSKTLRLGGTSTADNTIASVIANNSGTVLTSLQKMGVGTWVLAPTASNTLTGSTTVSNGTLKLREVSGNVDILPDAGAIIFNVDPFSYAAGGTLRYEGASAAASTETLGALTPTAGHASVQSVAVGGGSAALTFASMGTRSAGATLDISLSGGSVAFTAAPAGSNGIVGGWATFGGTDWLAAASPAAAYSAYSALAASGLSATGNYLSTADLTIAGPESVNSLKLAGAQTLSLTGLLTVATGGVLFDNGTGAATITGGALGASASEVIVTVAGAAAANALTIASPISGGAGSLTKAGPGLLVLSGANAYTGATYINQGTVRLSGTTVTLGSNSSVSLLQGATLDINAAGSSASNWNTAPSAARIAIGALAGAGTVVNTSASPALLSIGNGNGNGTFTGMIDESAGRITLVKNGSGTQSLTALNDYTGPTVIRGGALAVTSLANIGQPSGLGRGDATDADTNAASLIFDGGILLYTGSQTSSYDNKVVNIFQATGTPSVSIDRLFTLAGNAEIRSYGTSGSGTMQRADNNAALVFSNTGAVRFLGTGNRTLTLGGNSNADNRIDLRLVDNPNGGVLNISRAGYTAYWTLGNQTNSYTGYTNLQGGALIAVDGASLPTASNLRFAQDWAGGTLFQSVGTFSRGLGTGANQWQAGPVTGFAGFASDTAKFVVDWTGGNYVWGNADGTPNFLKGATLTLNSPNSLAELEIRGDFEIRTNVGLPSGLTVSTAVSNNSAVTLAGGNVSVLSVGQIVTGSGIPAGTYITGFNTQNQIVLNRNVTLTAGTALAFSGEGFRDINVNDNGLTGLDNARLTGVISGDGNLAKQGGGPLILGDANTYTGNTILRNEQLVVSSIGSAGATASSLGTNVGGGWLELGNPGGGNNVTLTYVGPGETVTRRIYLAGTTGSRRIDSSGSGPLVLTDVVNTSASTPLTTLSSTNNRMLELRGVNTDLNVVSSPLSNASANQALRLYKSDQGVWLLSGTNTYTGATRIDGGSLGFASAAAMGSWNNVGGTVNAVSNSKTITLATGNTTGLAVGTYVNGPGLGFGDTVASVANATTFTITAPANRSMTGGHPVIFGGLLISNGAVFSTDAAGLTIAQPVIVNNNSTAGFVGTNPITVDANIYKVQGGNQITLSNSLENGAVLTINGDYVSWQADSALTTRNLDIRGQGARTVWNGVIRNGLTANSNTRLTVAIPNASVFQLGGAAANTHTGGLLLYQGALELSKAGALGNGTLQLEGGTVTGNGLTLTGANRLTNLVLLNGEATKFIGTDSIELGGVVRNSGGNRYLFNDISGSGALDLTGGVQLSNDSANRILVMLGSGTTNFSSAIVNGSTSTASGLYYRGTGTINLTAVNTFGGELRMDRGTAVVSGAGTLNSLSTAVGSGVNVRNKAEFTLDNTAQNVVGGRIAGRAVTLTNGGLFRLIGNASGTTETAGPLRIDEGAGRILMSGAGSNVLTFASVAYQNSGSVLDLSGIGGLGTTNQVRFTNAPVHANYLQGIEARIGLPSDDFATYSGAINLLSGATTNGSANVTVASTAGLVAGMRILGANIPAGATIASITNATTFVLSANATAAASNQSFTATPAAGSSVAAFTGYSGATTLAGAASVPTATAKVTSA